MTQKLPNNFEWKQYLFHNYDLVSAGIDNQEDAEKHYLEYGKDEARDYRATPLCAMMIDKLVNNDIELTKFNNSLEAVVLLLTGKEIENGLYSKEVIVCFLNGKISLSNSLSLRVITFTLLEFLWSFISKLIHYLKLIKV